MTAPDRDQPMGNGPGFSRRAFIKGSGVAVAATAIATNELEARADDKATKPSVKPAEASNVTLNVNGKDHTLKLEPRVTLLDALRNDLNLTGCKDVCDTVNCGACTVHIDGKAVYACSKLAHECAGKKVVTVESLKSGDQLDPVVAGFIKHDASQCGFCTPGFVMAVRAFLNSKPKATLDEVRKGLGGNICRCGTYHGITACAMELAKGGT